MSIGSAVGKFYAGRCVFITGAAGFIGKIATEKLLRSCPEIERIYVLMRPKKSKTVQQRLEEMTKLPVFARLSHEQPNFKRKIVVVEGDLRQPGLGISDADHRKISADTSIIMHIAAYVHLANPIRDAVVANVLGTRYAIQLAHSLKSPEAFVHVSTAYSNIEKSIVEEKVYYPPMEPEKLIALVNKLNPEQLEQITSSLLGAFPNTYAYTKRVAEKLIENEIGSIPCAIVRPSLVIPTLKEPLEGWVDNLAGFAGLMSGVGLGFLRYMKSKNVKDTRVDLIPVDLTANAIIVAGWDLAANKHLKQDPSNVTVYNLITSDVSPITTRESGRYAAAYSNQYPLSSKIRKHSKFELVKDTKQWVYWKFDQYIELPLRCFVEDAISSVMGKKPKATRTRLLYNKLNDVLEVVTTNEWDWKIDNIVRLEKSLSPIDREIFSLNRKIEWSNCLLISWFGIKKFIFKESTDLPTLPVEERSVRPVRN